MNMLSASHADAAAKQMETLQVVAGGVSAPPARAVSQTKCVAGDHIDECGT
jgi:hypothetical protein